MDNPAITYDELKAALEEDSCARITEPALFALLDKLDQAPSLLGCWAKHPEHGRGIIASGQPDCDGEVRFAYRNGRYTDGVDTSFVRPESLDLDPVTLTTEQEFKEAPEGTIVEAATEPRDVYVKTGSLWYVVGDIEEANPTTLPPCRVIRWGENK